MINIKMMMIIILIQIRLLIFIRFHAQLVIIIDDLSDGEFIYFNDKNILFHNDIPMMD